MNKVLKLSFLLLLFNQIIFCDQESPKNMLLADSHVDVELLESQYCAEGFLQGTLIKTINGYIPIEQISAGDLLVGIEGTQEVLSVKKCKVDRYARLLLMNNEYTNAAMHQQIYLNNETLHHAAGLISGYQLLGGLYVIDNEIINAPSCCYSLTTEHHAFFIYPDILVHNFNPAAVGALGSFIIGSIEVSNPITIMLGIIIPLSVYAMQYFRSNIVYNYEFSEEDSKLTIEQLCLQNNEVIQKAREYFDIKQRALNSLHQDLIKIKNGISVFVRPNNIHTFDFSFNLLSQYKPAIYNPLSLIPFTSEMSLNLAGKEKLLQMRQAELDTLQQDIFDTHLTLVLHLTELIDRRDQAKQQLDDIISTVEKDVHSWNKNLYNISIGVALAHYKTQFLWKEMLDNLELKTNELKYVMSYYEKLKNNFFITKTTNFADVFTKQVIINKARLEHVEKNNAIWWSNMCNLESFLTKHNLLSHQLVDQYRLVAQQYRAEKDKNPILFAQKKQDDIKKQAKEKLDDAKKGGGGGGPEKDPDKKPKTQVIGYAKNVFTHAFKEKSGHLIDSLINRKLILDMTTNVKNFLIEDLYGNDWYGEILKDGRQLWAWARNGLIKDCGINEIPRAVTEYGLCKNPLIQ